MKRKLRIIQTLSAILLTGFLFGCAITGERLKGDEFYQLGEYQTAADYYTTQAEQGNLTAVLRLAWLYEQQLLPKGKDYQQALHWHSIAAAQGHVESMHNIAFIYEYGQGAVKQDTEQARAWYLKAAQRGYVYSQYRLAGLVVSRDQHTIDDEAYIEAYKWLMLAKTNVRKCTSIDKLCDIVARDAFSYKWQLEQQMNARQIVEAKQRVKVWKVLSRKV